MPQVHPTADAGAARAGEPIRESLRIAGEKVACERLIEVRHPYTQALAGTVPKASRAQVRRALQIARGYHATLTRHAPAAEAALSSAMARPGRGTATAYTMRQASAQRARRVPAHRARNWSTALQDPCRFTTGTSSHPACWGKGH